MKILNIVTGDEGGGGKAAYRLTLGLRQLGCDTSLYLASKFHPDSATVVFRPPTGLTSRLQRWLRRSRQRARLLRYGKDVDPSWGIDHRCQRGTAPLSQMPAADVINIHTIANFMDYAAFFKAVRVPVAWTLHVMAPFTGGCNYASGCRRFEDSCGCCPFLASNSERDLSHAIWREKRAAYEYASRVHLVSPSRWLATEVSRSSLLGHLPVTVIPNGIDTDTYAPRDRRFAREVLGLPQDASVLLFCTQHSLKYKVKGFTYLVEALVGMTAIKNLHLLTLGADSFPDLPIPHTHLGHVFNDNLLSLIYSAADLFVIPSLQDNLPNVVIESFACGTPVVGFDVGGIPDMVRPGVTGELVTPGDANGLRAAIGNLLQDGNRRAGLSANCRRIAVDEYSLATQAEAYLNLYRSLYEAAGGGASK
jgi:glycosyltransferase involved in cell wall biosynthesis